MLPYLFCLLLSVHAMAANTGSTELPDWTIAIYMNGDNSLDPEARDDLRELMRWGSQPGVNVIVLRDEYDQSVNTKTFRVEKGRLRELVDHGDNLDMGDWRTLENFANYVRERFPAKHVLLDIWSHGSGWRVREPSPVTRGISPDDHSGNSIKTPELGAVMKRLAEQGRIAILGMDACLMQMAEVLTELQGSADLVVASEDLEPGPGWDYAAILKSLAQFPGQSPRQLAQVIAQSYADSYNDGSQGDENAQLSVVDLSAFGEALPALDAFARELIAMMRSELAPAYRADLAQLFAQTQSFHPYTWHKDIGDLLGRVIDHPKFSAVPGLSQSAQLAKTSLLKAVLINAIAGPAPARSTGIAFWVPETDFDYRLSSQRYATLRWGQKNAWAEFLKLFFAPLPN